MIKNNLRSLSCVQSFYQ